MAVVIAMLVCVGLGMGVVAYVVREARRQGRGDFLTPQGEQLIAGARERGEHLRARTAQHAGSLRERLPERRGEQPVDPAGEDLPRAG